MVLCYDWKINSITAGSCNQRFGAACIKVRDIKLFKWIVTYGSWRWRVLCSWTLALETNKSCQEAIVINIIRYTIVQVFTICPSSSINIVGKMSILRSRSLFSWRRILLCTLWYWTLVLRRISVIMPALVFSNEVFRT